MPPRKRKQDEGSEAGTEADFAVTQNVSISELSTAAPSPRKKLPALPSKHTTSYGSPAPVLPSSGASAYGSNLRAATRDIVAAVQRDNKKAKLAHEAAQAEAKPAETSRPTRTRKPRQASVDKTIPAATPDEPSSPPSNVGRGRSIPAIPLTGRPLQSSADIEAELRSLQARRDKDERAAQEKEDKAEREAKAHAAQEKKDRVAREKKERAEREKKEAADRTKKELAEREKRERAEKKKQESAEQKERERQEQEEQERIEREEQERTEREERERAEQEQKEQDQRERKEAAERKKQERAEQKERLRREREEKERIEREDRQQAEQDEREQAGQAEQSELLSQIRIEREETERARQEKEAAARQGRQEVKRLINRGNQRHLLNRAEDRMVDRAMPMTQIPDDEAADWHPPKKRAGQEFLDQLFASPKRPRTNDQTPSAAHLNQRRRNASEPPDSAAMSTRSFVEESHVFNEANVQTPAPSSVMGDTPSRPPVPSSAFSRPASLPPVADRQRISSNPNEAQDTWVVPGPRPRPNTRLAARQEQPRRDAPVVGQEPPGGPGVSSRPSTRQPTAAASQSARVSAADMVAISTAASSLRRQLSNNRQARPQVRTSTGGQPRDDPSSGEDSDSGDDNPPRDEPGRRRSMTPPSPASSSLRPNNRRGQPRNPPRQEREHGAAPGAGAPRGRAPGERGPGGRAPGGRAPGQGDGPSPGGISSLKAHFRKAWNDWKPYFWLVPGVLVALLLALQMRRGAGSSQWDTNYGLEWYGWNKMGDNIGQLLPYSLRNPGSFLADTELNGLQDHISSQDRRISKLTDDGKDLREATQKLEGILPRVVSVKQDKQTSKLVIEQDFWHALKDKIHAEKSILTLHPGKDGPNNISDEHWAAVLKRLKAQGVLSTKNVHGIVDGAVSRSWDDWLRNNRGKVDKVLGGSSNLPLSPDAEKKLLVNVEKIVKEKISGKGLRDIVVTREDFIRELQKSISEHKREADAELAQVQDNLKDMIEAAQKSAEQSGGMSRQEVLALTNEVVQTAVSNAKLAGVANGNIINNFEVELSRRINYFALGNGATIDISLTSPTYTSPRHQKSKQAWNPAPWGSAAWAKEKQASPRFIPEQSAALTAWEDAGQCWCAGHKFEDPETHPADINIRLAHSIIPENVVMEHIDPKATIDAKAMPKRIEVWAVVDEYSRYNHARDFMFTHWPDTPKDHPLIATAGYLKLGEFTYEHNRANKGIQVYKLSDELAKMGIATDLVLIRAASNYGADHTCFYRIRLYGTEHELAGEEGVAEE